MRSLMIPRGGCMCAGRGPFRTGEDMFHGHIAALVTAKWHNRRAGRKDRKVVIIHDHFVVVDHTWERND